MGKTIKNWEKLPERYLKGTKGIERFFKRIALTLLGILGVVPLSIFGITQGIYKRVLEMKTFCLFSHASYTPAGWWGSKGGIILLLLPRLIIIPTVVVLVSTLP